MAYQALYRKWRPADFNSMVGQETIVATLRNQIATQRIAHAYLFCGSRGTGKTSTAKIMARAVNCLNPDNGNPCGECECCRNLLSDESLDVLEIDAASNNSVDNIRDLQDTIAYPPQFGRYKVYIVDEVHMLSTGAFNALLKTLEEPPPHVIFILATTEPNKLPATVLSRCQRFDFGRIPAAKIIERLRLVVSSSEAQASDEALNMIARAAEGGMRDALSILDMCLGYQNDVTASLVQNVLGTADRSFLFSFGDALKNEDAGQLMLLIDRLMQTGREPVVFAKDIARHLRSLLLAQSCPDSLENLLETTKEDADDYIRQANGFTPSRLMRMMDLFMSAETELRSFSSPRLALETCALKACLHTQDADPLELQEEVSRLQHQLDELTEKLSSGAVQITAAKPSAKKAAKPDAQQQPEAAAPPPPQQTEGGLSSDDVWKKMMDEMKRGNTRIFSLLSTAGRYEGYQDSTYHFLVNAEVFAGILSAKETCGAIEEALTRLSGTPSRFSASGTSMMVKQSAASSPPPDDFAAEDIISTFGADIVIMQNE